MSKIRIECPNCESEEIIECEMGDDAVYRCSGASESEIESRSGCGAWISFKEYQTMKEKAKGKVKTTNATSNKSATNGTTTTAGKVGIKPSVGGIRRPLSSLHSNQSQRLPSLHSKPATGTPSTPKPTTAPSKPANQTLNDEIVKRPDNKPAPPTTTTTPSSQTLDSDDDSLDSLDDDDSDEGLNGDTKVTSTSSTPVKLPKSKSKSKTSPKNNSTSTTTASFNLADPSVSAADRMRALRAKLAKQREKSLEEFREKYGVEGDEETEEDRAHAQRKRSGEAGEEFMASQEVERAPMVASLSIKGAENPLANSYRRPFTVPRLHGSMSSQAKSLIAERQKGHIGRRLGARLRIFSGAFGAFKALDSSIEEEDQTEAPPPPPPVTLTKAEELKTQPDGFQPLIIWQPTPEEQKENPKLTTIEVPMIVCKWLRPHQREGVKFMCECVLGQRNLGGQEPPPPQVKTIQNPDGTTSTVTVPPNLYSLGGGAILADDMGLGKTLQSVALLYTLLSQGFEQGTPVARKIIVVTPTSLVANWCNEIEKWLGKGKVNAIGLSEVGKEKVECGIDSYVGRGSKIHVLVISYDTFRRNLDRLNKPGLCDLLICDEAHRLKNNKTSTYIALDSLPCRRRVLLSGTPMQNDLSEFFSMINFTNRNILGDRKAFRRYYELPILMGREPDCLESDAVEGSERSSELSAIVNQFVLRRTNVLLRQHLPPKVIQVVCCRPSELQVRLYQHFLKSKSVKKLASGEAEEDGRRGGGGLQALPLITSLKKLCNHPKLIWDTAQNAANAPKKGVLNEETGVVEKMAPALVALFKGLTPLFQQYDGGSFIRKPHDPRYSGKMFVLERLLTQIRISNSGDRVVIVSNFTSALDVIAQMCQEKRWDHLRLDGTTSIKKRQQLVDQLSDHRGNKVFVFLLSSRAGGCGLNLIGANRLILFDPDWNPAVDKQAAARVWRDGQTKRCFVYRFLTTGSIEEKVYQRQLSKEGLSGVLGGSTADASLTTEELKDLFTLDEQALEQPSDTHKSLECECLDSYQIRTEAEATRAEEQAAKEAAEHVKRVAEAEAEEKRLREAETANNGETNVGESSSSSTTGDEIPADDNEPGAPMEGVEGVVAEDANGENEGGEGEGEGEGAQSSSDADGSDEEMDGFIANDSDDDGEEDYGSKKKSATKKSKKDGPRKQRKKRNVVGSLNYPQLHSLTTCTLGQRGEPPEEELINWAHHATSNSIPDPIFRAAAKTMPFTRGQLPFVSFVFSCEVSGKAILNSTDAKDAAAVSARCDDAPTLVQASKPVTVSLEVALAKHAEFMANERKKAAKRQGYDETSMEERLADPSKRRHSTRNRSTRGNNQSADEPNQDDLDFIVNDEDDGGGESNSKKRKAADDIDPATAALIQQMMEEDAGMHGRRRKSNNNAKTKKKKSEEEETNDDSMQDVAAPDADRMEDVLSGNDSTPQSAPTPAPDSSSVHSSPQKKRKVEASVNIIGSELVEQPPIPSHPPTRSSPKKPSPRVAAPTPSNKTMSPAILPQPAVKTLTSDDNDDFISDSDIEILDAPPHPDSAKPLAAKSPATSSLASLAPPMMKHSPRSGLMPVNSKSSPRMMAQTNRY